MRGLLPPGETSVPHSADLAVPPQGKVGRAALLLGLATPGGPVGVYGVSRCPMEVTDAYGSGRSSLGADDDERREADQERPVGIGTLQVLPPLLCLLGAQRLVFLECHEVTAEE